MAEPVPAQLNLAHLVEARRRPWIPARQAAAAAVLLILGGLSGWGLRGAFAPLPTGVDALAQEASANFAVYAPDRLRPVGAGRQRSRRTRALVLHPARPQGGRADLTSAGTG